MIQINETNKYKNLIGIEVECIVALKIRIERLMN